MDNRPKFLISFRWLIALAALQALCLQACIEASGDAESVHTKAESPGPIGDSALGSQVFPPPKFRHVEPYVLQCEPLAPSCPQGQGCYPIAGGWACAPDASGRGGQYGDACEFINACDPGLVCISDWAVPGCEGAFGCCSEICDLQDPAGDGQCPGANEGQVCMPWYSQGAAPTGYENVGICAIPS